MLAAAWLTAAATTGFLIGAIITAVYAVKAFREQSREVAAIEQRVTDQQQITGQEAKLIDVQSGQLDLQARPIYERKRDSVAAYLTIMSVALAVSRWIEARTGRSIREFVRTARRYRTIEIQAGPRTITAADPLPDDLRQVLEAIGSAIMMGARRIES